MAGTPAGRAAGRKGARAQVSPASPRCTRSRGRATDEARPRAPSAAGGRLTLASASRPSNSHSPSTHPHPSCAPRAPLYRGLRPEHPRRRGPGSFRHSAAGSGAHDGPPAHCARVHAPPLPHQTATEIPERALPAAGTTSPGRLRARPAAWRAKESGVFLVLGRWLASARGALGPCAALHLGACSFRGPRGLAWDVELRVL